MAYSLAQGDLIPFLGAGASAFAVAAETGKGLPRSALVPPRRTLLMDETEKRLIRRLEEALALADEIEDRRPRRVKGIIAPLDYASHAEKKASHSSSCDSNSMIWISQGPPVSSGHNSPFFFR
jgi:hypothetical protein